MPAALFQKLSSPPAPRFLQFGAFSPGYALECNRHSAGSGDFHVDQHIIGLSIGAPHKSEFAIESDKPERLQFRAGDLQIIPAGFRHSVSWEPCDFALLFLSREIMDAVARDLADDGQLSLSVPQLQLGDPVIEAAMLALRDEALAGGLRGSLYTDSLVTVIAARILRQQSRRRDRAIRATFGDVPNLNRIYEYIEQNLDHRLSLAELGSISGLGPFRFGKAFRKVVGVPPHRYVLQRRLERAKRLLLETEIPITEVALTAGFNSHSHLSEVFRRVVGFTPSQFRAGGQR